jgi:hypothetical protein
MSGGTLIGGGTPGTGGASGSLDRDAACLADTRVGEQVPIDLYFMVDETGSMKCHTGPGEGQNCPEDYSGNGPTRWEAVTKALQAFVEAPANAGVGVGIGFFPKVLSQPDSMLNPVCLNICRDCDCLMKCGCSVCRFGTCQDLFAQPDTASCDPNDYLTPAVEIAPLPGVAHAIVDAIGKQSPRGGTPTAASLHAAIEHAKSWAAAHPDRRVAVVYATDGEPEGCEDAQDIGPAVREAQAAYTGSPSLSTYVLGVGPSLDNLNQVAEAGGTMRAYLVDAGKDVAQQFTDALNDIRTRALSCDYAIPKTSSPLDYGYVNVQIAVGTGGAPTLISPVADQNACGSAGGWYYDNPSTPSLISLCKATCDPILAAPGSRLEVLIGCQTIPRID